LCGKIVQNELFWNPDLELIFGKAHSRTIFSKKKNIILEFTIPKINSGKISF